MKYCPICGTMTFNDAQFCMSCLHVFKIDDETIREVEEEKEPLLAAPTPQLNLAYPWWAKEGFTRWPGAQAKLKFNLGDCDDDCFVYRRTKDEFEEFIYWNEEHFAYKAFMRKHGVPYKS